MVQVVRRETGQVNRRLDRESLPLLTVRMTLEAGHGDGWRAPLAVGAFRSTCETWLPQEAETLSMRIPASVPLRVKGRVDQRLGGWAVLLALPLVREVAYLIDAVTCHRPQVEQEQPDCRAKRSFIAVQFIRYQARLETDVSGLHREMTKFLRWVMSSGQERAAPSGLQFERRKPPLIGFSTQRNRRLTSARTNLRHLAAAPRCLRPNDLDRPGGWLLSLRCSLATAFDR